MLKCASQNFQRSNFTRRAGRCVHMSNSRPVSMAAGKRVLVPIADGSEEMEAVIVIDCLRRAGERHSCAGLPARCLHQSTGFTVCCAVGLQRTTLSSIISVTSVMCGSLQTIQSVRGGY